MVQLQAIFHWESIFGMGVSQIHVLDHHHQQEMDPSASREQMGVWKQAPSIFPRIFEPQHCQSGKMQQGAFPMPINKDVITLEIAVDYRGIMAVQIRKTFKDLAHPDFNGSNVHCRVPLPVPVSKTTQITLLSPKTSLRRRTSEYSLCSSSGDRKTLFSLIWFQATSIPRTSSNAL
nr:hypothetical protein Iba_chr10cCG2880 [Ipomoea batatas]